MLKNSSIYDLNKVYSFFLPVEVLSPLIVYQAERFPISYLLAVNTFLLYSFLNFFVGNLI